MNSNIVTKGISFFLGVSMLALGLLKFIHPFKGWYASQIEFSELPFPAYSLGISGEIVVGLSFLFLFVNNQKLAPIISKRILQASSFAVIVMMITAFYVHLHPEVPADILPLKIKPPIIPGMFLVLGITNLLLNQNVKIKKIPAVKDRD